MKKFLQLLGCATLLFMFSCSDDDPKIVPAPDSVYKPFQIKGESSSDVVTLTYALADHFGFGDVCYTEMTVSDAGGVFDFTPYENALFCNSESYTTLMPSVPVYTLASVDKVIAGVDGEKNLQSVPVTNGGCENGDIKVAKGENDSFVVTLPKIAEDAAKPVYRLVFSCNYGADSPYNNVKAVVYVDRVAVSADE